MTAGWSTPKDISAKVRRLWADGSLLRAYAEGDPFPLVDVRLRGPRASEIGDDLAAVQQWIARLDAGRKDDSKYALTWTAIGGRHIGRNRIPARAMVTGYRQAWEVLGVHGEVRAFDEILALVAEQPTVRGWVVDHPLHALELAPQWPRLLAAYAWLDAHRQSGRYLREISAPGVDTKFAERHRPVLALLLGVPANGAGFLQGLGLRAKPELVRMRCSAGIGLPEPLSEVVVRVGELTDMKIRCRTALVIENEISYLSVDVPAEGIVLWGKGFEVDRVGRLRWLADTDVVYWGDLDTHGFGILDRLRAWLPQTRSVLMDRETLMAHQDRWVSEQRPAASRLRHLTPDESALYAELVADRLGDRVRLEQELIDWSWVQDRLSVLYRDPGAGGDQSK